MEKFLNDVYRKREDIVKVADNKTKLAIHRVNAWRQSVHGMNLRVGFQTILPLNHFVHLTLFRVSGER